MQGRGGWAAQKQPRGWAVLRLHLGRLTQETEGVAYALECLPSTHEAPPHTALTQ